MHIVLDCMCRNINLTHRLKSTEISPLPPWFASVRGISIAHINQHSLSHTFLLSPDIIDKTMNGCSRSAMITVVKVPRIKGSEYFSYLQSSARRIRWLPPLHLVVKLNNSHLDIGFLQGLHYWNIKTGLGVIFRLRISKGRNDGVQWGREWRGDRYIHRL